MTPALAAVALNLKNVSTKGNQTLSGMQLI